MRNSLRGLIFDLDGTLGDTLPVCFAAFREVFQQTLGKRFSDAEIRSLFGPTEEGILARLAPDSAGKAIELYLEAYVRAHAVCPAPFPGIAELVEALGRRACRLAVVTGKGPRSAAISLDVFGLSGAFEPVEAGSPRGGVKAESMRRVLAAWGLPPATVASVGDAVSDVRAAREVGVTPLGAAWASTANAAELAAQQPEAVFRSVGELRDWVLARMK